MFHVMTQDTRASACCSCGPFAKYRIPDSGHPFASWPPPVRLEDQRQREESPTVFVCIKFAIVGSAKCSPVSSYPSPLPESSFPFPHLSMLSFCLWFKNLSGRFLNQPQVTSSRKAIFSRNTIICSALLYSTFLCKMF